LAPGGIPRGDSYLEGAALIAGEDAREQLYADVSFSVYRLPIVKKAELGAVAEARGRDDAVGDEVAPAVRIVYLDAIVQEGVVEIGEFLLKQSEGLGEGAAFGEGTAIYPL